MGQQGMQTVSVAGEAGQQGLPDRNKSLVLGALVGALLGASFAWVATSPPADGEMEPDLRTALAKAGPVDYFRLGIALLNVARQFGEILRRV